MSDTKKTNKSGAQGRPSQSKRTSSKTAASKKNVKKKRVENNPLFDEIIILISLAVAIVLLLSNFNIAGSVGKKLAYVMFGLFGIVEYIMPVLLFLLVMFIVANKKNNVARIKAVAGSITIMLFCTFVQLFYSKKMPASESIADIFTYCASNRAGGGLFGSVFYKLLNPFGVIASFVIVVIFMIIGIIIVTERSFISGVKKSGRKVYDTAKEELESYREESARRYEKAAAEPEKVTRVQKKQRGVTNNTKLVADVDASIEEALNRIAVDEQQEKYDNSDIISDVKPSDLTEIFVPEDTDIVIPEIKVDDEPDKTDTKHSVTKKADTVSLDSEAKEHDTIASGEIHPQSTVVNEGYKFPPISLLNRGSGRGKVDSQAELNETAIKLQQVLQSFGVKATVTNKTRGPAVTRYELTPEQGVKVSRIVSLADDIKLNLAAADIRIEAPIPGKAAVGIEVPNKETSAVMLRDLVESEEFKKHPSNICFGAGKDIGGKVIIADIASMPHLLIAGSTGSGKSVCINTIIMSILYKANPNDVKLIMIDPKVVELKIYNGIPHLMIPVVTDCKKAAGALNWAVAEMDRRYKLFADANVRDLKGYNAKVEELKDIEDETKPVKLPQIVIIVDEVAELMMVAQNEVEGAIVRLAQLARAAGIHLVIATQRPTVNVITGLIKANVPSKIAFAVASGIDSRTIIDRNGAEKLLGKGDMLYFPASYPNPVRVQGAFVSDKEVSDVVEYIKEHANPVTYNETVAAHIETSAMSESQAFGGERDVYFEEAGRFIIEKQKASIGMIQRMYKVGFNRAARIMDQLTDAGVVGPEEGTKPRKILMTMEEFEQLL